VSEWHAREVVPTSAPLPLDDVLGDGGADTTFIPARLRAVLEKGANDFQHVYPMYAVCLPGQTSSWAVKSVACLMRTWKCPRIRVPSSMRRCLMRLYGCVLRGWSTSVLGEGRWEHIEGQPSRQENQRRHQSRPGEQMHHDKQAKSHVILHGRRSQNRHVIYLQRRT
jgi:hypothetical protein